MRSAPTLSPALDRGGLLARGLGGDLLLDAGAHRIDLEERVDGAGRDPIPLQRLKVAPDGVAAHGPPHGLLEPNAIAPGPPDGLSTCHPCTRSEVLSISRVAHNRSQGGSLWQTSARLQPHRRVALIPRAVSSLPCCGSPWSVTEGSCPAEPRESPKHGQSRSPETLPALSVRAGRAPENNPRPPLASFRRASPVLVECTAPFSSCYAAATPHCSPY